jgi:mono/diheme cytochrome c family protein
VGEPGHTLGGRVLRGYGFPPTEGGEPLKGVSPPQPTSATQSSSAPQPALTQSNPLLGDEKAIARGSETYRARCVGCHKSGGGSGPNLFKTKLSPMQFFDVVARGRKGTVMPSFSSLLTIDQVWEVHAFLLSRDGL